MKKKIAVIVFVAILIASMCIVIAVRQKSVPKNSTSTSSYDTAEDAMAAASFNMEYPDRLCGYPVTGFEANSSTIEINYGTSGFIRKTLGVTDNSGNKDEFPETDSEEFNEMKITFKGKDSLIYQASWTYNNFAYTISLFDDAGGIDKDEMTEYIQSTR